jgi:putative transcriptional regulator
MNSTKNQQTDAARESKSSLSGSLRNHFLIAMPGINDPQFTHSITYICDHNADGAMGVMINRPMDIYLQDVFEQLNIDYIQTNANTPVLSGGPVSTQRGFILHPTGGKWQSTLQISPEISLTASKDIISSLADGSGPANAQIALGYSGWGAGQLEAEIKENSWLTVPADAAILFNTPLELRWHAAAKSLGIDMNLMSLQFGNA